ncbi:MAG TPA: SPOR domain-containing protein [Nitrosospira sp.]|nr:SPOR domain-containing protein [Nitrosospira sp.]
MAKTLSEDEIQLRKRARRRLIGAIVLVAVTVVVLPMVLDNKPEQRNHEIEIRIPAEDAAGELPPQAATFPQIPSAGVPDSGTSESQRQEAAASQPGRQSSAQAGDKDKPAASSAAPGITSGGESARTGSTADMFVVQLGAFADPAKARQQLRSLTSKEKDIKVYTETIKTGKGTGSRGSDNRKEADDNEITRVRAGPFRTREEAEVARERLRKLGFEGVVTDK